MLQIIFNPFLNDENTPSILTQKCQLTFFRGLLAVAYI